MNPTLHLRNKAPPSTKPAAAQGADVCGNLVMNNPQVFMAFISEADAENAEAGTLSQQMPEALLRTGHSAGDAALIRDIVVDHAHGYRLANAAQKDQSVLSDLREGYAAASQLLMDRLMA
ncbi:hypothetical protein JC607_21735 [Paracoccus sp. IB05]|nr:hypothetical protein [Paracoccus sp. IB05]